MLIGDRIKIARIDRGLTQQQLGALCGMADSAIRRYENNRANPKIETLQKIADALNIPLTEFYSSTFDGKSYVEIPHTKNENERTLQLELIKKDYKKNFKKITLPVNAEDEIVLLSNYEKLNAMGKKEAHKRVQELTEIQRYTEPDAPELNAAHANDYANAPEELKKQEENIMDDEDF